MPAGRRACAPSPTPEPCGVGGSKVWSASIHAAVSEVLLGVRHALDGERGFTAARRAEELHHVAARKPAAERLIERAEAGWEEGASARRAESACAPAAAGWLAAALLPSS